MAGNTNISHGIQQKGSEIKEKAQDLADKARNTASNIADKARDTASNLADRAKDTAATARDRAEDAMGTVGQKMTQLAGTIRDRVPQEGTLGNAASTVAQNLQAGGQYLQDHNLNDMGQDVTRMVKQYPLQALLVSFGIGALLGMTFRR
jgi:ElaB/YqjD/DUF883 family membrane-anchored ribosome-binding protein